MRSLTVLWLLGCTMMLSAQPAIQWQRNYGGTGSDQGVRIVLLTDGGFVVGGSTNSNDGDVTGCTYGLDAWLLRLDGSGNIVWSLCLGDSSENQINDICRTADGGTIALMTTFSSGVITNDLIDVGSISLVKVSDTGMIQWQWEYRASRYERGASVQEAPDGSIYLFGHMDPPGQSTGVGSRSDFYLAQFTAGGVLMRERFYGGSNDERSHDMFLRADGSIVLIGIANSSDGDLIFTTNNSKWFVFLDENLNIQWQRIIYDNGFPYQNSIGKGNVEQKLVTGGTNGTAGEVGPQWGGADIFLADLFQDGPLNASVAIGGSGDERSLQLFHDGNSTWYCVGATNSTDGNVSEPKGATDGWVLSVNEQLGLNWQKTLGGSDHEVINGGSIDNEGNLILVGYSRSMDGDLTGNMGEEDLWVLKLDLDGVSVPELLVASWTNLFPNPANDQISISWNGPASNLAIHDILGKLIHSNNDLSGRKQIELRIGAWPEGVYTIRLLGEGAPISQRFIKY